jgi:DNA mismatch repair ATPase MutS
VEKQVSNSNKGALRFLYQLEDGFESKVQHYGIETATMAGLPDSIINKAYELKEVLTKEDEKRNQRKPSEFRYAHTVFALTWQKYLLHLRKTLNAEGKEL